MSETKSFEELFLSQNEEDNLKINHIKILLVNNINSNHMYLIKLKEWQIEHQELFDYLIFLGNFLENKENSNVKIDSKENLINEESEIGSLLTYFENICLKVIYIGGSNDSKNIFTQPYPSLTMSSVNLHQQFYKLANDLYLIGFGGPITIDKYSSLDITMFNFKNYIKDQNTTSNIQVILVTNDGMDEINNIETGNVISANNNSINNIVAKKNKILDNLLKSKDNNILINLNGNKKLKKGMKNIYNSTIINPGFLCDGEIGILILERDIKTKNWKIKKMDFISI